MLLSWRGSRRRSRPCSTAPMVRMAAPKPPTLPATRYCAVLPSPALFGSRCCCRISPPVPASHLPSSHLTSRRRISPLIATHDLCAYDAGLLEAASKEEKAAEAGLLQCIADMEKIELDVTGVADVTIGEILDREPELRAEIEEEIKNNIWAP